MVVRTNAKNARVPATSRSKKSARNTLEKNGIKSTSKRSAPAVNAPASRLRKPRFPDKPGVRFNKNDAVVHLRDNPVDSALLPKEITPARFRQAMLQAISDLGDEEGATTSGLLGRCWEILGVDFPHAREHCDSAVMDSIEMLDLLVKELPDLGFHSAIGEIETDPMKQMKKMFAAIEERVAGGKRKVPLSAKERKLAFKKELFKMVEYVEDFKINGQKYHDGCFMLKIGDSWLMLVPTEFKTAGSKGVRAQMMVSVVRFSGVGIDSIVTFRRGGKLEAEPIHAFLGNPLYREAIGIKAASEDGGYFMSDAITGSVVKRIQSAITTNNALPAKMRTKYDPKLANYAVSPSLIKVKADLLGMRAYIFNFLNVVPKRKK